MAPTVPTAHGTSSLHCDLMTTEMADDWRNSDGRNVFQMIDQAGGVGIWVRRTTWDGSIARIVGMSEPSGPPPYYGSPKVIMDVYSLSGIQRDELAHLSTAGTYKTWRQIEPPSWATGAKLRELDDPAIQATLEKLTRRRTQSSEGRLDLDVPFTRKDEAKALGARWDGTKKTWWLPAEGTKLAQDKARALGFLS